MKKILIIGTGGTIASVREDNIRLGNPFRILDFCDTEQSRFHCVSPFCVLSENINLSLWQELIRFIDETDSDLYKGIIVLHGSDTLAYTAALLANAFKDKSICVTASDKPVEDESSNAKSNFADAVNYIEQGNVGVAVSYNGIKNAEFILSADENDNFFTIDGKALSLNATYFKKKNILIIRPYVGINYDNYNLENIDAVLHTMYHSATAPDTVSAFIDKCKSKDIPFFFVTSKSKAEYESAKDFKNILFNTTLENAYASLLLTNTPYSDIISSSK